MNKKRIIILGLVIVLLLGNIVFADSPITNKVPNVEFTITKEIKEENELVKYDVQIPAIQGLSDMIFQEKINNTILDKALDHIEEVEQSARYLKEASKEEEFEYRIHEIYIDFEVKSSYPILSFNINTYLYTGGANGITFVDTYSIDTEKNKELQLKDLFLQNSNYKEIINNEISKQIEDRIENENEMFFEGDMGFKTISDEQCFYMEDDSIIIIFQKYDIAPGAMGIPKFEISLDILQHILKDKKQVKFLSFTGIVKEIIERDKDTMLRLENEEGQEASFIISDETYIIDNKEIQIGAKVKGFYDGTRPMILIYPPQYSIEVLYFLEDAINVKFDYFDKNLISSDNMLKLNISEETEIVLENGTPFTKELTDQNLIVFYGPSTKSIPAQTTPYKIIVMLEKAAPPISDEFIDVSRMDIIVDNRKIDSPDAYTNENNVVMVPIRPICEALDISVNWHNNTQSVTLGNSVSLASGNKQYIGKSGNSINLSTAPEIHESRLFVPLDFFREILAMNNAYVFEGQIVIDNNEIMK